jgi:phospholipid/cholesterol/gamma-HCH transport system ATP-binding protein
VYLFGTRIDNLREEQILPVRRRAGYVFQNAALFDSLSVFENVAFPLREHTRLSEGEITDRVHRFLALVGLPAIDDLLPAELSGGMRKRVGIARAIALKPRYILYDEPTTGLDPITAAVMDQLIMRTRDLGVTGLVVTHDMRSAFTVGDRVAMLHDGTIRQVGSVDQIQASHDPVVRQFIEGRPSPTIVEPAVRRSAG